MKSAARNLQIATDRYRLGIDPYLNVITAQTTLQSNQQTAVNLRIQQITDSVQLIEALGGGWDKSQLPSQTRHDHQSPASHSSATAESHAQIPTPINDAMRAGAGWGGRAPSLRPRRVEAPQNPSYAASGAGLQTQ